MGTCRQANDVTERSGKDADTEHRREGGVEPRRKNHPALGEVKQGEKIIKLTGKSFSGDLKAAQEEQLPSGHLRGCVAPARA